MKKVIGLILCVVSISIAERNKQIDDKNIETLKAFLSDIQAKKCSDEKMRQLNQTIGFDLMCKICWPNLYALEQRRKIQK